MKSIPLANGRGIALVDDEDYERLTAHSWCIHIHRGRARTITYAQANIKVGGEWKRVLMHRFIVGLLSPRLDHKDGNGLNNTRENLREATANNNQHNSGPRFGRSKFKGVSWHKKANKWMSQIRAFGQYRYLGLFEDEEEAAVAYDTAAKEMHGEFAKVNFH